MHSVECNSMQSQGQKQIQGKCRGREFVGTLNCI